MKKIFIALLTVGALASCKKDYVCTCTTTTTSGGTVSTDENTYNLNQVTKKYVESSEECASYDRQYTSSSGDISTTKEECIISDK